MCQRYRHSGLWHRHTDIWYQHGKKNSIHIGDIVADIWSWIKYRNLFSTLCYIFFTKKNYLRNEKRMYRLRECFFSLPSLTPIIYYLFIYREFFEKILSKTQNRIAMTRVKNAFIFIYRKVFFSPFFFLFYTNIIFMLIPFVIRSKWYSSCRSIETEIITLNSRFHLDPKEKRKIAKVKVYLHELNWWIPVYICMFK